MGDPRPSTPHSVVTPFASSGSGEGMDRRIERRPRRWGRIALWALGAVALLVAARVLLLAGRGRSLRVDSGHLVISDVVQGTFEDFIPVRGTVTPLETVFLDAIEGGRVERVLVEDGASVVTGQPLVELSNTGLQLDVIARETAVTEQLNVLRSLEIDLERTRQGHARDLNDVEYDVTRLTREAERRRRLFSEGIVSHKDLTDAEDELQRAARRLEITREGQEKDRELQLEQFVHLKTAADQLVRNLGVARRNLESLVVRAPMAGRLSGFEVEVGQSIAPGARLGRVDAPDRFKLTAEVDEFYLARVEVGQRAKSSGEKACTLEVNRIRPQVQNGRFGVDLVFTGEAPAGIRRGQTLQLELTLGDSSRALLLPSGAFLADGGGVTAFVVSADGGEAALRPIRTGRRNASVVEVLEGLRPGDRVVTSSYKPFEGMDRLSLEKAR